jgi:hypothetical protein
MPSRATMPSRNGSVTARCLACGDPLPAGRNRTTCSDSCRQAMWRRRHQPPVLTPPPLPPAVPRKPHTVYECPACDHRALGEQRCECGTFMRRIGFGGITPCCGEPATYDELLES